MNSRSLKLPRKHKRNSLHEILGIKKTKGNWLIVLNKTWENQPVDNTIRHKRWREAWMTKVESQSLSFHTTGENRSCEISNEGLGRKSCHDKNHQRHNKSSQWKERSFTWLMGNKMNPEEISLIFLEEASNKIFRRC